MRQAILFAAALGLCLAASVPARHALASRTAPDSDSRPSAFFTPRRHVRGGPWASGDWVALLVPEEEQDLNGDGDTKDAVLHVVDVRTLQVINLGLAVDPLLAGVYAGPLIAISGNTLAALVSERDQGNKDLN